MYQWKIRLDTLSDANDFLFAVSQIPEEVYIRSGKHLCTSAKSALGCHMARIEWNDLICECERDIYTRIRKFVIDGTPNIESDWISQ